MNINEACDNLKAVSTKVIFQGEEGKAIAIKIQKGEELKEHITKTPAFLILISGETIFENENGLKIKLLTGDFVQIEANVKHWLKAETSSDLMLLK